VPIKTINLSFTSRLFAAAIGLAAAIIFVNLSAGPLAAQAEHQDIKVVSEVTLTSPDYRFRAQPCDSLTKLVRRAIMTFDEASNEIELSKEGIIYAETNIVQSMGAYLLDIDDEVIVRGQDVIKYATNSLELTESQREAWSVYIPSVDFELIHTQEPENIDEIVQIIQEQVDLNDDIEVDEDPDETVDTASTLWWFAGLGSAVIIWYLLWKREDSTTE